MFYFFTFLKIDFYIFICFVLYCIGKNHETISSTNWKIIECNVESCYKIYPKFVTLRFLFIISIQYFKT